MDTRADIQAKLAAIDQRKAEALKALQAKRAKLKAKLAQLNRPTKSARRLDARRKILLGAFVLEQLERTGSSPQALTFEGKKFEYKVYDNAPGGHYFNRMDSTLALQSRHEIYQFLAKYLHPDAPAK